MALRHTPTMARLPFVEVEPESLWRECVRNEHKWEERVKQDSYASSQETVVEFRHQQAIDLVWTSNVLEDTIQTTATSPSSDSVFTSLKRLYDFGYLKGRKLTAKDFDAKDFESTEWPFVQHLLAYECLSDYALSSSVPLTEAMICEAHSTMVEGHQSEDDDGLVRAGSYRQIPVHAGDHCYPDYRDIPHSMSRIIYVYNERFERPHDSYELAAWLYYSIISLHPFEDGNGRLCRLLWSYSLTRDGLPFPLVMSSGHRKAQKHCVWCIVKGRKLASDSYPHLTTLTVWSAHQAWQKFFDFCN